MKDSKVYLERLKGSLKEKLFFKEYLDLDNKIIIDFGCADGIVIKILREINNLRGNKCTYIGVERNKTFFKMAEKEADIIFHNLKELELYFKCNYDKREKVFITSSVLHECGENMQRNIKRFVLKYCNYWVVRDMFYKEFYESYAGENLYKLFDDTYNLDRLRQFFKSKKTIDNKVIAEWLLKYTYIENWETEIKEDYFATIWEMIECKRDFEITYDSIYINDYLKKSIMRDYGIDVTWATHRQMILKVKKRDG